MNEKMNIHEILERASHLKIAVVGDLIEDHYMIGRTNRISPEAPVLVLKLTEIRSNPGGAGNVVENLKGLGIEVSAFYGDNKIIKTRVMAGSHHLLRIDDEEDEPNWMTWDQIDIGLGYGIEQKKYHCVILSDYGKGCVSPEVAREVIARCCWNSIPVVVDSKYNLDNFEDATTVKCNLNEWNPSTYLKKNIVENLVITQGAKGMRYWGTASGLEVSGDIPAYPIHISDTCGAGDTVTAVLGMMQALGYPIDEACTLANIAGSEVVQHSGVVAITKETLIKRFNEV